MKTRAFTYNIAKALKVDQKTVILFGRYLKEAGLLTTGARGVNAPHMSMLDLSRVVIALLSTDVAAKCVDRVKKFSQLTLESNDYHNSGPKEFNLCAGCTLEQALENYFSNNVLHESKSSAPFLEIHENSRKATIKYFDKSTGTNQREIEREVCFSGGVKTESDRAEFFGVRKIRGLASIELMRLWLPFFIERRDGITWEETYRGNDLKGYPLDPAHPHNANLPDAEHRQRLNEIHKYMESI